MTSALLPQSNIRALLFEKNKAGIAAGLLACLGMS
jgi:hypothetical protein